VEVDDQQVNLDRFNLFFPEKRPFFLENAGFFTVCNPGEVELFSAGGSGCPRARLQILAGGRVSGKAGKFNACLTRRPTRSDPRRATTSVSCANRDLPNRSAFAGCSEQQGPATVPGPTIATTHALDGKLGLGQNTVLSGFVARTDTPGVTSGRQYAYNVRSRTNLLQVDVEVGYQEVGERFNPEVGFLSRGGYRKPDLRVMTRFRPADVLGLHEIRTCLFRGFDGFQEPVTRTSTPTGSSATPRIHGMNLTVRVSAAVRDHPGVSSARHTGTH
jgi:hypothetical protein